MGADKLEVIYYEMIKMEQRLTKKGQAVLEARDAVEKALQRFELLQKELIQKLEEVKK